MRYLAILLILFCSNAYATQWFLYDAESATVDTDLPHNVSVGVEFCQSECGGVGTLGVIKDTISPPNGTKYFQWTTFKYTGTADNDSATVLTDSVAGWSSGDVNGSHLYNATDGSEGEVGSSTDTTATNSLSGGSDNSWDTGDSYSVSQFNAYTVAKNKTTMPILSGVLGTTYHIGYYMRFDGQGSDIWNEGTTTQSADKGIEIRGNGVRWVASRGQWSSYSANDDHKFTMWIGNPTYHLNPSLEFTSAFYQNQNGYSETNPIQLSYNTWYGVVMSVKMASDLTGSITLYIDGVKILEELNIITTNDSSPTVVDMEIGGTIEQPMYSAPEHLRQFDTLQLTDDWQDILDVGYGFEDSTSTTIGPGTSSTFSAGTSTVIN